jgi:sodium-dependent dicarboxylate transporter 2/3/5
MQKWDLHKRIALSVIYIVGTEKKSMVLGFMISSALLSMFLSNTSTSIMMLPIGIAIVSQISSSKSKDNNFAKVLMLGIAYSASIGGFATLYGTPPNLILVSNLEQFFNYKLDFNSWLIMALPLSIVLLFTCWFYLINFTFDLGSKISFNKNDVLLKLKNLGNIRYEEIIVLIIFISFVFSLLLKSKISLFIPFIDDTIIAIFFAVLLFIFNSKKKNEKIISWEDSSKIPWGIILLFGGGLSLAAAMIGSGLALWIGEKITVLNNLNIILILISVVLIVNFLTEITSNLATVSMILPILASVSISIEIHPLIIMVGATIAASCAFMLPVATPPNAVVFGSGFLKINDMVKTGIILNIISIIIVSLYVYYILPLVWSLDSIIIN